ncbi:MAG: hypothetical protein VR66_02435, partial [Peptococcaceae bacterium BRH_c23]
NSPKKVIQTSTIEEDDSLMIYFETPSSFSHWLSLLFSFQRPWTVWVSPEPEDTVFARINLLAGWREVTKDHGWW